ncbi:prorelaxin-like [Macrotis lagotis]|uniref:prorelaxin-like n=1 Tax=Macrotis lagotis TaxID=92651 RepID=UPI003D69F943
MLPLHLLGAWLLLSLLPAPGSPQEVDDAPLQVCGREFVRAVLSICGAPGWRRDRKPQRQPGRALGQFYVSGESGWLLIDYDEFKKAIKKNKNEINDTNPLKQYNFKLATHAWKKRARTSGLADHYCYRSCTKNDIAKLC